MKKKRKLSLIGLIIQLLITPLLLNETKIVFHGIITLHPIFITGIGIPTFIGIFSYFRLGRKSMILRLIVPVLACSTISFALSWVILIAPQYTRYIDYSYGFPGPLVVVFLFPSFSSGIVLYVVIAAELLRNLRFKEK
ncbi:MAG TPA: hypothetical protein PLN69_10010 [bacterium]|nr:hypothetical protein [bacterium]